jgi:hypothetical protein
VSLQYSSSVGSTTALKSRSWYSLLLLVNTSRRPFIHATSIFNGLQTILGWNSSFKKKNWRKSGSNFGCARKWFVFTA